MMILFQLLPTAGERQHFHQHLSCSEQRCHLRTLILYLVFPTGSTRQKDPQKYNRRTKGDKLSRCWLYFSVFPASPCYLRRFVCFSLSVTTSSKIHSRLSYAQAWYRQSIITWILLPRSVRFWIHWVHYQVTRSFLKIGAVAKSADFQMDLRRYNILRWSNGYT